MDKVNVFHNGATKIGEVIIFGQVFFDIALQSVKQHSTIIKTCK